MFPEDVEGVSSDDDPFMNPPAVEDAPASDHEHTVVIPNADDETYVGGDNEVKSDGTEPVAPKAEDKVRRGRGGLEMDVKAITDAYATGEITLGDGELLTSHRIVTLIASRLGCDQPSGGAVSNVLTRWSEIGYAAINPKPLAFVDYTDDAVELGLSALKARAKAAAKAAAADANASA